MRHSRGRFSRVTAVFVMIGLGAGVWAGIRHLRSSPRPAKPLAVVDTNPAPSPAPLPIPVKKIQTDPTPVAPALRLPAPRPAGPVAPRVEAPKAPSVALSGNPMADTRAKSEAGDLLTARNILNEAMLADRLGAERDAGRELAAKLNQQIIFSPRIFKDDTFCSAYVLQSGDRLTKVASNNFVTWELLCRVNSITDPRKIRALQTIKIVKGPFHAVVTKKKFTMDLYLGSPGGTGSMYVLTWPVGLGKDDSTPAGTWQVAPHAKLKNPTYYSPRGEGVIQADDPKNPLGKFWIGLVGVEGGAVGKPSYGIHGTIDSQSIGKEASMGCIRMRNEDVQVAFELLVEGKSTVVVKD